jgi:signal transduction histidine kinase
MKSKKTTHSRMLIMIGLIAVLLALAGGSFYYAYYSINELLWAQRADSLTTVMSKLSLSTEMLLDSYWDDLDHDTVRLKHEEGQDETAVCTELKNIESETANGTDKFLLFYESGEYVSSSQETKVLSEFSSLTENSKHNMAIVDLSNLGDAGKDSIIFFSKFESPLTVGTKKATYLASVYEMSVFDNFFSSIRYNSQSGIYLVKANGTRVYHQTDNPNDVLDSYNLYKAIENSRYYYGTSYSQFSSDIAQKKDGTVHLLIGSSPYMLSYSSLTSNDWVMLMTVPSNTVSVSTADFTKKVLFSFSLISIVLVALLASVVSVFAHGNHQRKLQEERAASLEKVAAAEKQANEAKTTFLSNMSHDVRTPMNGIIGMLNIAEENMDNPEVVKSSLGSIRECSDHLLALINDVLDMSRIESGKVEIKAEAFNLLGTLDGCVSIIKGELQGRQVDFRYDFSGISHPFVIGDEVHLQRIIINILGNSVKFTEDGHSITFKASEESREGKTFYRFDMSDTGIGMSEEFQRKIFDSFSQENRPSSSKYKGTGLGMAITKRYVTMMGGQISLQSKINEGTRFLVELPFEITEEAKIQRLQSRTEVVPDLSDIRILLVEDNDINLKIAESLLTSVKAEFTSKRNGKEAVEAFISAPAGTYDLILMDIMMPIMNGHEASRAIRSSEKKDAKTVKIIAMTADAFAEDIQAAKEAGMDDHISKPIDKSLFYWSLDKYAKEIREEKKK